MELYDVMRTTFAAREFAADPVPDDVLFRILENARFAPSGGNRQGWHVIIVRDQAKRARLAELMLPAFQRYRAQQLIGESPWQAVMPTAVTTEQIASVPTGGRFPAQLATAPVVLLICVDMRVVASMDQYLDRVGIISGASVYPFAWNILLAARNEGLGGTLTTFIAAAEPEVKPLFAIPGHVAVAALLPLGKPMTQLTWLRRKPVAEFATVDAFDGPAFAGYQPSRTVSP
jgi:nitroreductase